MTAKTVTKQPNSPFVPAVSKDKRVKLFLWGQEGTLKTRLALSFPSPVTIDMENGSDLYADDFKFQVKHTTNPDEVMDTVAWLLTNKHNYKTLIIDPITIYWAALQDKWRSIFMQRKQTGKGFKVDFYEFQPGDWITIKAEFKRLIRQLMMLDMNVIVTAHQKKEYAEGEIMKVIGDTFDGEKSLPYVFDIVVQTYKKGDKHFGQVVKDRTYKLPTGEFSLSYDIFEKAFGKGILGKTAVPVEPAAPEQVETIKDWYANAMFLVTPENQRKLLDRYQVEQEKDLTKDQAQEILNNFEEAYKKKKAEQEPKSAEN